MKSLNSLLLLMLGSFLSSGIYCSAELLSRQEILRWIHDDSQESPLGFTKNGLMDLGSKSVKFKFVATAKGNGVLYIGDAEIRIYDSHDNGAYYDDSVLNFEPVTIGSVPCLIFSGIVHLTGEKGELDKREEAVLIIRISANGVLQVVYENGTAKRQQILHYASVVGVSE